MYTYSKIYVYIYIYVYIRLHRICHEKCQTGNHAYLIHILVDISSYLNQLLLQLFNLTNSLKVQTITTRLHTLRTADSS